MEPAASTPSVYDFEMPLPPQFPDLIDFMKNYGIEEGGRYYKEVLEDYRQARKRFDHCMGNWKPFYEEWKRNLKVREYQHKIKEEASKKSHRISLIINSIYIMWCEWVIFVLIRGVMLGAWVRFDVLYYLGFVATIFIVLGFALDLFWKLKPHKWMVKSEIIAWRIWMITGIINSAVSGFIYWWHQCFEIIDPLPIETFVPFVVPILLSPIYLIPAYIASRTTRKLIDFGGVVDDSPASRRCIVM